MAHIGFYALCCVCFEWRRNISPQEDKHAKIALGTGSIEASPIIGYQDANKARVSTMYVGERVFMDQITKVMQRSLFLPQDEGK